MEQGVFGRLMLSCGISAKPTADCCSIVSHPAVCLHSAVTCMNVEPSDYSKGLSAAASCSCRNHVTMCQSPSDSGDHDAVNCPLWCTCVSAGQPAVQREGLPEPGAQRLAAHIGRHMSLAACRRSRCKPHIQPDSLLPLQCLCVPAYYDAISAVLTANQSPLLATQSLLRG